jgi:hypothetical protein
VLVNKRVHPRFRTLTTGFLSEDLVSSPQRRVFFLGTSVQVHFEVWTGYWESRFRSFIENSGHLGSGPRRFWGPRSFQDLVLFLSPRTDGQTPCLLLYIGLLVPFFVRVIGWPYLCQKSHLILENCPTLVLHWFGLVETNVVQFLISKFCFYGIFRPILRSVFWISKPFGFGYFHKKFKMSLI